MIQNNNKLVAGLLAIPVAVWLFVIIKYSVNVPWYDDFDPFPDFLRHWINAGSIGDKLHVLLQPNNEHRMVVGKLVTLIYYWLTGTLNFTFLHLAGAGFTLGTLFLFWKSFKDTNVSIWWFLPVIFFLFQLQYHLVYLWAICSLQHQPVVFFVCLSMFLLSREKLGWAIIAAVCANYAMSNGIFVWAAGGMVLGLRSEYRKLLIWCGIGVLSVMFYFHGLTTMGNEQSIEYLKKYPELSVLGFFAFLGGLFDLLPERRIEIRTALPVLMGALTMIWVVRWLWIQVYKWYEYTFRVSLVSKVPASRNNGAQTTFLLGIMIFLLVNALIIGLLRPRFGFFVMVVSNYKLYPALFLTVSYLAFISTVTQRTAAKAYRFVLCVSISVWVISICTYLPIITERSKYLKVSAWNQNHNGFGLGHVPFSEGAKYVDDMMKEMVGKGIYTYPQETEFVNDIIRQNNDSKTEAIPGFSVGSANDHLLITDSTAVFHLSKEKGSYAFLQNEEHRYIYKLELRKYEGRNLFRLYVPGSDIVVPFKEVKPGQYQLGVVRIEDGRNLSHIVQQIEIR